MICIIALIVFGILGIFSASHRQLAKEAFDCVFRRLTLRPCNTGFDQKMRGKIVGKLLTKSPKTAGFVNKNFELISWAFIIIFVISTIYVAIGGYNYYLYGNCNGPNEDGFCVFDPLGENNKVSGSEDDAFCSAVPASPEQLTLKDVDLSLFPYYNRSADNEVVFIGCYGCPYTRKAYPDIKKLIDRDDVNVVFAHFATKKNTKYISNILNCVHHTDTQKFIEFNDKVFNLEIDKVGDENEILRIVEELGFDKETIRQCSYFNETIEITNNQMSELQKTGVYGTPTVFVNGKAVVGPKPYRVYKRLLN